MLKLRIKHQESYSRGELLLRSLFGFIYIALPHYFILGFLGIWSSILAFVSWWIILFTGKYPKSMWEFQEKYLRWSVRVSARLYNISDGYPAFGLDAHDDYTEFKLKYPEKLSRVDLILKSFFGIIYVVIPHIFVLYFRILWNFILMFIAWWVVLFTGNYPKSMHEFTVGTIRWTTRLNMYFGMWMTDKYPPFTGKETEYEKHAFADELNNESETKEIS